MQRRRRKLLPAPEATTTIAGRRLGEARLFAALAAAETTLDGALFRAAAGAEAAEALHFRPVAGAPRTLRIVVSSHGCGGGSAGADAWWALRVQGGIVGGGRSSPLSRHVARVSVHGLPPPAAAVVDWLPDAAAAGDADCFELRRAGPADFTAKVVVELRHSPPVHRVSAPLARVLGLSEGGDSTATATATAQRVALALWAYVRRRGLFAPGGGLVVEPDAPLRAALAGRMSFAWTELPQVLAPALLPPVPLVVDFPVRAAADPAATALAFTVPVMCDGCALDTAAAAAPMRPPPPDTARLDAELDALMARIEDRCLRLRMLRAIAADPVRALAAICASKLLRDTRLAETVADGRDPDEDRRAETYTTAQSAAAAAEFLERT